MTCHQDRQRASNRLSARPSRARRGGRVSRCLDLTSQTERVLALWMLTAALTVFGVLLGLVAPAITPDRAPAPTLHGTIGEALSIFVHNLRVLAAPLILAAARWGCGRISRPFGDVIVSAVVVTSPLLVGLALARHGSQLIVYLPHLPLEWAALSVAAAAWLAARSSRLSMRTLMAHSVTVMAITAIAAIIETTAIPHAG